MKNVDAVVGTKIITGCLVTPKGRAKAVMGGAVVGAVAGSAGRVATQSAVEQQNATASPLPPNAFSLGYLAVTETDLVLVRGQQAMMGPKAKDIVATVPRSEVAGAHMAGGTLARPLTLEFGDGVTWELEVPRANVKHADAVLRELGITA